MSTDAHTTAPVARTAPVRKARRLAAWLAMTVNAMCVVMLGAGWGAGVETLVRLRPGLPAVVPGTIAAALTVAVALLLVLSPGRNLRRPARLLALAVAVYCLLRAGSTLVGYLDAPPDQADRMAVATSGGLFLAAIAVWATAKAGAHCARLAAVVCSVGIILCLIALDGYLLDQSAIVSAMIFAGMSPISAFMLLLLYGAALLARSEHNWTGILFGDGSASRFAQRVLPVAILLPVLISYGSRLGTDLGLLHPNLRLTVLSVGLVALASVIVLYSAAQHYRRETQAEAARLRLRAALDGLDVAAFVFGQDGWLEMTNRTAETLCAGAASVEAWLFDNQFHSLDDRRLLADDENPARLLLAQGEAADRFVGWMDSAGTEHALRFCVRRPDTGGDTVLSVIDETQSWTLRETLARDERIEAVGQMADGITHEVSNILGVVRLSAETALLKGETGDPMHHLRAIRAGCDRGVALTERLLNLTREPRGDTDVLNLSSFLGEVAELATEALPPGITLRTALPNRAIMVRASATDLQLAVLNLVLNARNALTEGQFTQGEIVLGLKAEPDGLIVTVTDNGPGMTQAVLHRARDAYFTTRRGRGGTGLGLAMVESLARRVGGTLDIRSSPGAGTTVTLTLPPAGTGEGYEAAPEPPDLSGTCVLLVGDDPRDVHEAPQVFRALGARIEIVSDGDRAIALLDDGYQPDLLVTDVALRGTRNGYRLAAEIGRRLPGAAVIYLSDFTDRQVAEPRAVAGLVLRKPVRASELINAVALTLRHRARRGGAADQAVPEMASAFRS